MVEGKVGPSTWRNQLLRLGGSEKEFGSVTWCSVIKHNFPILFALAPDVHSTSACTRHILRFFFFFFK